MAATNFRTPRFVSLLVFYFLVSSLIDEKLKICNGSLPYGNQFYYNQALQNSNIDVCILGQGHDGTKCNLTPTGFFKSSLPASKWSKRGQTSLLIPGHDPPSDITVFMDISPNPGPSEVETSVAVNETDFHFNRLKSTTTNMHNYGAATEIITYSRSQLMNFRRCSPGYTFDSQAFGVLKDCQLLRYRSKRAGKRRIPARISDRVDDSYCSTWPKEGSVNTANLTVIPRTPLQFCVDSNSFKSVDFCLLNTRSVKNKSFIIKDYVVDHNIDIMAMTETWLRPGEIDEPIISDLCPTGYHLLHVPRESRGGGVAILHKKCFKFKNQCTAVTSFRTFEFTDMLMRYSSTNVRMVIVYRTPPSQKNRLTVGLFFDEFTGFLERLVTASAPLCIVGDFNFHVDVINDPAAVRFNSLLEAFNLKQHIDAPTHRNGHTLDLVITRADENFASNFTVADPIISDHFAVHCRLSLKKPSFERREICYRKLRSIDKTMFCQDILNSTLIINDDFINTTDLVKKYNKVLSSLLERHAPLKKRVVTLRPAAPWYSDEIREGKTKRRKLERRWRATRLTIDRELYVDQCNVVNSLIFTSKMKFYAAVISDNKTDQKVLFRIFDKLLNRKPVNKLPSCNSARELANRFADFFTEKIIAIRDNLTSSSCYLDDRNVDNCSCSSNLCEFLPTSAKELTKLIGSSACKSCILDPLPGSVLKDCLDVLIPVITRIVNLSLAYGVIPKDMKEAVLSPLLKKSSLDHELFKNFRPISNLMFISKCTEKVVASRINNYVKDENMDELFQSAYKQGHSTETALVRVQNDILRAIDNQGCVILLLLDLSAAFDTVDHKILISRLSNRFGISGKALAWFRSYLTDRSQFVCVEGEKSSSRDLNCGVPQGSVLGPILYLLYTSPLGDIVRNHKMSFHFYADDTQIYVTFQPSVKGQMELSKTMIEACLRDIDVWMLRNKLKLNNDKSELLVLSARHRPLPPLDSILVGNETIHASKLARNIGVVFDHTLSMEKQVTELCKSAFYHIRNIARIRKFLSFETSQILIHAFVTAKLDYCNSLLYGLPKNVIHKLQIVQNSAARLLTCSRKFNHITPILLDLHWLPVEQRIIFKILLLTYKAMNNIAPLYLTELLEPYVPSRPLRSSCKNLLKVPKHNLKTYGARAFSLSAPILWNTIPEELRNADTLNIFKNKVKTFLFKQAFKL